MADLQKPKRALPFKRTSRPKPPPDAAVSPDGDDDDGLSLFSQSKKYFPTVVEDQQRRARERAEKAEQERKEKLAREQEEKERKDHEVQIRREQRRRAAEEEAEERESSKKKKRRYSIPSDIDIKEPDENADPFDNREPELYVPSTPPDTATATRRDASILGSSRASASAHIRPTTRPLVKHEEHAILLDDSDDEDSSKKASTSDAHGGKGKVKAEDNSSDIEMLGEQEKAGAEAEGEEEDPSEMYIKAAMERMRKAKEARAARASSGADGDNNLDDDRGVPVSVMIAVPALPEAKPLCCTVRTAQALQIAFDTFKERQKMQTTYPHKILSELVFTWRGDRVYHTTKLETLGICPKGADGRLHDSTRSGHGVPEGYMGKDKVYFEAWTPEDYAESQEKRERERKRLARGEWWRDDDDDDDDDAGNDGDKNVSGQAETSQKEDDRVRVIFKAKDMPPRNVTLRKYSTVAHMVKAFRKLAGLGEDKKVEIRWDGEVLDLDTTVEEADIGDMDSVEVHIR